MSLISGSWCLTSAAREVETSFVATGGMTFGSTSVQIALVEARARFSPNLQLASAIGYLDGEHGYSEVQARFGASVTTTIGRWVIDDRNMISLSSESVRRYRNRLRATLPGWLGHSRLSAQAFNELYFDLDHDRIVRNNIAVGFGAAANNCCRVDLYHVWTHDRGAPQSRYLLVLVSGFIGR